MKKTTLQEDRKLLKKNNIRMTNLQTNDIKLIAKKLRSGEF